MPVSLLVYRCLIISPGDVVDARDVIEESTHHWNAQIGRSLGTRVDPVRWESHARPEMGGRPQEIINRQIVDDCDFGIALFWYRLGTPTIEHESGSIEEVYRLLGKGCRVMVYFCDAPIPQSALQDDQFARLKEVKKRFMDQGLLSKYTTTADLSAMFTLHLTGLVNELLMKDRLPGHPIPTSGTITAPTPDIRVTTKTAIVTNILKDQQHMLAIGVENHSPLDFFLQSVGIETADGSQLHVQRDAITRENNGPRRIESGNSYSLYVEPAELIKCAKREKKTMVCAIATDKIGRVFRSDPEHFNSVLGLDAGKSKTRKP